MAGLVKKLYIKEGYKALIINAPEGYLEMLDDLPPDVSIDQSAKGEYDFIQLFVKNSKELDKFLTKTVKSLSKNSLLWICYPKGTSNINSDLNRDILWKKLEETHKLRPVAMISIDETWSAMRFKQV